MEHSERVAIVDFGSQVTQLIARRIRELHVYCEIVPPWVDPAQLRGVRGLVLSGGPASVSDAGAPSLPPALMELGVPVLGICYGLQLLAVWGGGRVEPSHGREYGRAELAIHADDPLLANIPRTSQVWMSHGDGVAALPDAFAALATSGSSPLAVVRHRTLPIYGVQFHPEVAHTEYGVRLLENFLRGVVGLREQWTMHGFVEAQTAELRERLSGSTVICGVSGGVDSTVVAALLSRAIGERLACIYIDTGLMRANETAEVREIFGELGIELRVIDASSRFLERLAGIEDPEKKRVTIGHTFVEVFEEAAKSTADATYLAQGTLYPDVIESVSVRGPSATIKTHHNVGGLPERMHLKVVEPLRELFKDEVRELAEELGIPHHLAQRHPFPGPGLAIRILGEVTAERLALVRAADAIVIEEVRRAGWYEKLWQAFAVFLPVRSVGVMGDARTYEHTIAVRCVTSKDAMTGDFAALPHDLLGRISSRIINEVAGINRVVYDISSKPPATIEWE